jgi:ABC-type transport system involved in multi-copper enzyme maturation permease subunit
MRSSVYSLVLTFFTFFLILPIIDAVGSFAKFKPWFSVTFANGIARYVFDNPYPTDQIYTTSAPGGPTSTLQTYSLAQYHPEIRLSLIVMAVYFIVAFALSIFLARRREM